MERKNIFFLIFTISGFTGLIYESIWTHYLKLFLGHAAYAQTLVLAIFMGGMAIGSFVCSRYSQTYGKLLIGYALAEGAIGISALLFHPLFDRMVEYSYTGVIPRLGLPVAITAYKWGLSTLMILPQSVLLGMTFPLMSAALIRMRKEKSGSIIAMLYFSNSIGAVVGVLASGFLLVRLLGLPGTISFAGVINVVLAVAVILLASKTAESVPQEKEGESALPAVLPAGGRYRLFLLISLATGMASFIYEVVWIRMLSLVLGSSTHAFELMLSSFILGLACGGLWIKRRIDTIENPVRFLAVVQVVMGLLALATLPLYGSTFEVMRWLLGIIPKNDQGYTLFNFSSHALAFAVMLPATFCAGMTLPLITHTLLRERYGERSIGDVYGANTIGAIIGVFLAIHLGLPLLGIKGALTLGACFDLAIGIGLLWYQPAPGSRRMPLITTSVSVALVVAVLLLVRLDPYKMASGVYRQGQLITPSKNSVIFHEDGKTATVSLTASDDNVLSIRTNGKIDAAVALTPGAAPSGDESTMILAGVIPLALNPGARTAANIGLGSGLTSHTLLSARQLERVDTIEIEKKMVEAARAFGRFSALVYSDPRSAVHVDDAKTFFSAHNKRYDIIVSEPSNPWISGVASLFSEEFYRLVKRHLTDEGVFVQWLQLYEINLELVASVFKAIDTAFDDYAVYASNYGDILIVCKKNGAIGQPDPEVLKKPELAAMLKRLRINGVQDIEIRRIGDRQVLAPLMDSFSIRINSDYYPVLDQGAARSRFLKEHAQDLQNVAGENLPILDMLAKRKFTWDKTDVSADPLFLKSKNAYNAMIARDFIEQGKLSSTQKLPPVVLGDMMQLRSLFYSTGDVLPVNRRVFLFNGGKTLIPHLSPAENDRVWRILEQGPDAGKLSVIEREYVRLFKALGQRDARAIGASVSLLLANELDITPARKRYLIAAGMLAATAQGDRKNAQLLWERFRNEIAGNEPPGTLFRCLAAHSGVTL